jgi:hypothetical protein
MLPVLAHSSQVIGPPEGYRLYDEAELAADPGALPIAEAAVDATSLDLSTLGLADGRYTLGLSYVDDWGSESERTRIAAAIESGAVRTELLPPSDLRAWAIAGGKVTLTFALARLPFSGVIHQPAAEYEIAEAGDLSTILATVAGGNFIETELGPFNDGDTVRLRVRASDGQAPGSGGLRGPWIQAPAVVADASAPPVPTPGV